MPQLRSVMKHFVSLSLRSFFVEYRLNVAFLRPPPFPLNQTFRPLPPSTVSPPTFPSDHAFSKDTINVFVFVERGIYFFFLSRRDDITIRRGLSCVFGSQFNISDSVPVAKFFSFLKTRFFSNSFTKMSADKDRSLLVGRRNFENRLGLRRTYDRNFHKTSQIPSSVVLITLTLCFSPPTVITYIITYSMVQSPS